MSTGQTSQHPTLAAGRWFELSLAEQLGNVGSEYERAWRWKRQGRTAYFEKAFARMLELLDLTLADKRWHNHRLKELTRLREQACQEFDQEQQSSLSKYLLYFGILARSRANS